MKIKENSVVTIEYSVSDMEGNLIDSSGKSEAFTYIHGHEMTLPGIEEALDGKEEGFEFKGVIPAAKGYGLRSEEFYVPVPKAEFENITEFSLGMKILIENHFGETQEMVVVSMDDTSVTIDANSPYAGKDLDFTCKVLEIREATQEDLDEIKFESDHHHHDCGCGDGCGCSDH